MNITRASHFGMCFGVRDAIELAFRTARRQPLTILGQLVHNEAVIGRLRAEGIGVTESPPPAGPTTVMITAHGASQRAIAALREGGLNVLEATCPLVKVAHAAVLRLARDGYHPVIVGQRDHVEVRGLTGDLDAFDVVLNASDIGQLREYPRFGVAAQTTQPIERVRHLAQQIRERFPASEVRLVDTVCRPTKDRQHAAVELAETSDVVIVVGGAGSNNTRELVARCSRHCARVHHVQGPDDLHPDWFLVPDRVGLTAGTSTPDDVIAAVEQRLREIASLLESHDVAAQPAEPHEELVSLGLR